MRAIKLSNHHDGLYAREMSIGDSLTSQEGQMRRLTFIATAQLSPKYVIDSSKPFHIAWWAATLGVSQEDLVRAVNAVGTKATDVSLYLRRCAGSSAGRHSRRSANV
jgi:hypothetical protein